MNIETPAISLILTSNLAPFLDTVSITELSMCNSSFHSIITSHIQKHFIFNIPIFALESETSQKFLKIYKNAKKISNKFTSWDFGTESSLVVLPPGVTHYSGPADIAINLPPSVSHLNIKTCDNENFTKFPPNLTHFTNNAKFCFAFKLSYQTPLPKKFAELPKSLKVFHFSSKCSVEVPNFPPNLTHLTFCLLDEAVADFSSYKHEVLPSLKYFNFEGILEFKITDKFFPSLTHLLVGQEFNQNVDNLPPNLTFLAFGSSFNQPVDHLPQNLKILALKGCFNQKIDQLPPYLTYLCIITRKFDHSLDFLPDSLSHLEFSVASACHSPIDNLPTNLKLLQLINFTKHIDHLPVNLAVLFFSSVLNSPLSNLVDNLPPNIAVIVLTKLFNQKVDHLPQSIASLTFGDSFNQCVDHLPESVLILTFGSHFNQPVDFLPSHVLQISFGDKFNQDIDYLPPFLIKLSLGSKFCKPFGNLPSSLKTLIFGTSYSGLYFNLPSVTKVNIQFQNVDYLPSSITSLTFGREFNENVDYLPASITQITFGGNFNKSVDNLPVSVISLSFSSFFNQPIDHLPSKLTKLTIVGNFNQNIDNLPENLMCLELDSSSFDHPIDHLPSFLRKLIIYALRMGKEFYYLPSSLTHLHISSNIPCLKSLPNLVEFKYTGDR